MLPMFHVIALAPLVFGVLLYASLALTCAIENELNARRESNAHARRIEQDAFRLVKGTWLQTAAQVRAYRLAMPLPVAPEAFMLPSSAALTVPCGPTPRAVLVSHVRKVGV
jgi:hypothetical protein